MGILISDTEVMPGDVVLNFCDPAFLLDPDEARLQTREDHLVRLLAYVLYARRVFVPGRYFLEEGPFFEAAALAPQLLQEGLVVPDIRAGCASFEELLHVRGLAPETQPRAAFLDQHAKHLSVFQDRGLSERYRCRLIEDLGDGGALDSLAPGRRRELDSIAQAMNTIEASREGFRSLTTKLPTEVRREFDRWAAVRYYTTPMEDDPVRVRDIPHSAARLLKRASQLVSLHVEDPTLAHDLPDPMTEAAQRLRLAIPRFAQPDDLRVLVEAVLHTRADVPEAQEKLAGIIERSRADGIVGSLNEALRKNLMTERLFRSLSKRARDHVKEEAKSTGVDLAVESALGPIGAALNFARSVQARVEEEAERRRSAPWRMSYEHLAQHLQAGALDRLGGAG